MEIKTIRSYYVGVRLRIRSHVFAYVLVTIRTSVRHCTATNTNVCESTLVYIRKSAVLWEKLQKCTLTEKNHSLFKIFSPT